MSSYNADVQRLYGNVEKSSLDNLANYAIKWSSSLKSYLLQGKSFEFNPEKIVESLYRPFAKQYLYMGEGVIHRSAHTSEIFPTKSTDNMVINFMGIGSPKPFAVLATKTITDLNFLSPAANASKLLPFYRYDKLGNRLENIIDWGLKQFRTHYGKIKITGIVALGDDVTPSAEARDITKKDIFGYVYGVLHNPAYRKKYELNLRREFPRIPFYGDFARWAVWGEKLLELHLDFETVEPYPLVRVDLPNVKNPKAKLKADKTAGEIVLDTETILSGVPAAAWDYKLGNRSGLEWVLERYKERTPKDKTVAERFNSYRFTDYKEEVILLLRRVCAVSVQTSAVVAEMAGADE